jgi:hypothetical protein
MDKRLPSIVETNSHGCCGKRPRKSRSYLILPEFHSDSGSQPDVGRESSAIASDFGHKPTGPSIQSISHSQRAFESLYILIESAESSAVEQLIPDATADTNPKCAVIPTPFSESHLTNCLPHAECGKDIASVFQERLRRPDE